MSKRKAFVVPLKNPKLLKSNNKNENEHIENTTISDDTNIKTAHYVMNETVNKILSNEDGTKGIEKDHHTAQNTRSTNAGKKNNKTRITRKKAEDKISPVVEKEANLNKDQTFPEISLPYNEEINNFNYDYINGVNYTDINKNHNESNFNNVQMDLNNVKDNFSETKCSLLPSEVIVEDPYELMINALVNIKTETEDNKPCKVLNSGVKSEIPSSEEDHYPDLLDISYNTGKYCTLGPWDFEDSQESEKCDFLEEDQENLELLQDVLRRGKLTSEWQNLSKNIPLEERVKVQKESENSIILLARARQTQIAQEATIIKSIAEEDEFENLPTKSEDTELEKDRRCEEIAKYTNKIWRRPVKANIDSELLEGPVLNPPLPNQYTLVAFTPAGQKYTVNMMEGRPKKFKNIGTMMMWDLATKINMQRMIAQVEEGSFFPASLDYKKEKAFKNHIESQKKRLARWISVATWDDLENDLNFLIAEKELILTNYLLKKWRSEMKYSEVLKLLNKISNVEVNKQMLVKNPQILSTLFKLTQVKWKTITQKASEILEKYKIFFKTTDCQPFKDCFQSELIHYEKAKGHLRDLYQEILITVKFNYAANNEDCRNPRKQASPEDYQNNLETLPSNSFSWD